MDFTVRFANPFIMTTYTGAALAIGWAVGAHWGHVMIASMTLIAAAILL